MFFFCCILEKMCLTISCQRFCHFMSSYAVTWVFPPFPPTCTLFLFPLPRQPNGICSIYSTSVHSPSDHLLCFFPSVPVIFSFCPSVSCYDPLPALCTPACLPQPLLDTCVSSPLPTWLLPVFKFELASLVSGSCFWVRTCFD